MPDWIAALTEAGERLRLARDDEREVFKAAREIAVRAIAAGQPEAVCASMLGVDRMTVRKWVGK